MAKKPLKLQTLAKLRQFSQGMDPGEFLKTEWRQVTRALEQAYVNVEDSSSSSASSFELKGFYATNDNSYTTSGNLPFSNYVISTGFGLVASGYIFRPTIEGDYWVEISPSWTPTGAPYNTGTWTSTLDIKDEAGTTLRSNTYYLDQNQTWTKVTSMGPLCAIAKLNASNGVYFSYSASNARLDHLSFKIHKIND